MADGFEVVVLSHALRHIDDSDRAVVQSALREAAKQASAERHPGEFWKATLVVKGKLYEYHEYNLAEDIVNIGTVFPLEQ